MKKISILFSLIVISFLANAQKKQNTYFYKDNGKEVALKDSADYIRIIQEPDSGETNFIVQEFFANGKRKLMGKVSSFEPKLIYEGSVVCFNENGNKKSVIFYEKDYPIGKGYYFFEDGKIQKEIEYLPKKVDKDKTADFRFEAEFKLVYQVDSLGTVYVKEGNGHLIDYTKIEKDTLIEEGDYKDGFKDGVWKGKYASGKSSYVENYASSKFVSGVNAVGDKNYEYKILEMPPQFNGGVEKFYRYLGKSIRYPSDAVKNNTMGRVNLSFTVEKDGSIVNVLVVKSVSPSIDAEAKRVVAASPKWIPAMQRGVPVKVKYNIPISFNLGR